ncbi:MAG: NADH-quinone oxidoreductase subunit I [Syntrophus sp. (in: bacteria)]|nr:NADH-quinone oxidoreductase subunit I [Syntrophus sp. (in: bacteria)]
MSKALLRGLFLTLRHFFRKPETIPYPEAKRPVPERFRGRPVLISGTDGKALCVACGLCERVCPCLCITVVPENGSDGVRQLRNYILDLNRCSFCGLCVEACPVEAIRMGRDYELAVYRKEELIMKTKALQHETGGRLPENSGRR